MPLSCSLLKAVAAARPFGLGLAPERLLRRITATVLRDGACYDYLHAKRRVRRQDPGAIRNIDRQLRNGCAFARAARGVTCSPPSRPVCVGSKPIGSTSTNSTGLIREPRSRKRCAPSRTSLAPARSGTTVARTYLPGRWSRRSGRRRRSTCPASSPARTNIRSSCAMPSGT